MGTFSLTDVIDGVKKKTTQRPKPVRQPVFMKDAYIALLLRHYESLGMPPPDFIHEIQEAPRYAEIASPAPEPTLPQGFGVQLQVECDEEQGVVTCTLSTALCELDEEYYSKAAQPPIEAVMRAYSELGFSKKYLASVLKNHDSRIARMDKVDLNKVFKVGTGSKTTRKTVKKKDVVVVEEENDAVVDDEEEEEEEEDDNEDDGAFDMEIDEEDDQDVEDDVEESYMSD